MIARIRKDLDNKEKGFTLIELLVVIIIIGILAAIAIPLFLNQRKKAVDTAARSDAKNLGTELAAWYVDNSGAPPTITGDAGDRYTIGGVDAGLVSDNLEFGGADGTSNLDWCVQINILNSAGTLTSVSYSAEDGITNDGTCGGGGGGGE